jgi:GTP cyclohydrolase IB
MKLPDTQNERDIRNVALKRVGVRSLTYPWQIREQSGSWQATVASLSLSVDLSAHHKGTHMSRFLEALENRGTSYDLAHFRGLAGDLLSQLQSEWAQAIATFSFFQRRHAPVSKASGFLDYQVTWRVEAARGCDPESRVTVAVPVATLCPCSKAISERGAHNQRGHATLSVEFEGDLWIEELIEMVEGSASSPLYPILKRPDEKFVTEAAYDNPVFVEDLVRNIALRCRADERILWYAVEAENFESIHNHNAFAHVEEKK